MATHTATQVSSGKLVDRIATPIGSWWKITPITTSKLNIFSEPSHTLVYSGPGPLDQHIYLLLPAGDTSVSATLA